MTKKEIDNFIEGQLHLSGVLLALLDRVGMSYKDIEKSLSNGLFDNESVTSNTLFALRVTDSCRKLDLEGEMTLEEIIQKIKPE